MNSKKTKWLLVMALLLIVGGGLLAYLIQTGGNTIKIQDARWKGNQNNIQFGFLYIPPGVTKEKPAPGIIATHGNNNSLEMQDGFAIEFARRGYVVLADDLTGHGFSESPAWLGGEEMLNYFRTLDIVDKNNIGLEGHSMGGWASVIMADKNPDGYKSLVLVDSATGVWCRKGDALFPRNTAVIFGAYEELSRYMWSAPIGSDVFKSNSLKTLFGTTENVEAGKLYGSIEAGTARKLYMTKSTHPGATFSPAAIGAAVDWMQMTIPAPKNIPADNQIWYWKEIGTFIAAIGMILLLFPLGALLLQTGFFKELSEATPVSKAAKGFGWWIGAVLTVLIPLAVFFKVMGFSAAGPGHCSKIFPQVYTNVILLWIAGVAAISLILFLLWHFIFNRKNKATFVNYGLTWKNKGLDWKKIGKSFLLAVIICIAAYLTLVLSYLFFKIDYRLWLFVIKPMAPWHFRLFLTDYIPFLVYFLILGLVVHGQLRRGKAGGLKQWQEMLINIFLLIMPFIIWLAFQYGPLFAGGEMPLTRLPEANLWSIFMIQFLPLFTMVALVSTYFYRKTGHIYTGAFLNALLITWIVVASQLTFKF